MNVACKYLISTLIFFGIAHCIDIDFTGATTKSLINEGFAKYFSNFIKNPENFVKNAEIVKKAAECAEAFNEYLDDKKYRLISVPPDKPTVIGFVLRWFDYRLSNMTGLQGCAAQQYVLPCLQDKIWFSPFSIENSATDTLLQTDLWEKMPIFVTDWGLVEWRSAVKLTVSCDFQLKAYPLDWQNCYAMFRAPYLFYELIFIPYNPNYALFLWDESMSNPMWDITGQMVEDTFPTAGIKVSFRLVRKSSYYYWVLMGPTFIISFGTILPFLLPLDAGDKLSTMLTMLLSYFFVLVTLTSTTPLTSESMPVLLQFYIIIIGLGMLGAFAIVLMNRHLASKKVDNKKQVRYRFIFCPKLSDVFMNNAGLVVYASCLAAAYIYLFVELENQRQIRWNQEAGKYNYTSLVYSQGPQAPI